MTGDTANGRSISVVSRFLPRKSNLAIAHAGADAEHQVRRHRDRRREQRQLQRRNRVRAAMIASMYALQPLREGFGEDQRERQRPGTSARNASTIAVSAQRSQRRLRQVRRVELALRAA